MVLLFEGRDIVDQSLHCSAGFKSIEVAAQQKQDFHARGMGAVVEFRFDELVLGPRGHRQSAAGIERHSIMVDMGQLVVGNLRGAVRRSLILAPISVIAHDAFRQMVRKRLLCASTGCVTGCNQSDQQEEHQG